MSRRDRARIVFDGRPRLGFHDPDDGVEVGRGDPDRVFQVVIDLFRVGRTRRRRQLIHVVVLDLARLPYVVDGREIGEQIVAPEVVLGHPAQTVHQPADQPRAVGPDHTMHIDRIVLLVRQHLENVFQRGAALAARKVLAAAEGTEIVRHLFPDHRVLSRARLGLGAEIEFAFDPEQPQGGEPFA